MPIDPKTFHGGELLKPRNPESSRYWVFVERITKEGVQIELICPPVIYETQGEIITTYTKLRGHGCVVPHEPCSWWEGWDRYLHIGVIPSLIGSGSVRLAIPM